MLCFFLKQVDVIIGQFDMSWLWLAQLGTGTELASCILSPVAPVKVGYGPVRSCLDRRKVNLIWLYVRRQIRHDMWKVARKSKGWEEFSVYARLFIHLLHFRLAPKASFKTFSDLARESARTLKCNFYGRRVMINKKFMLRWGRPSVLIPISGDPCHLHQYFPYSAVRGFSRELLSHGVCHAFLSRSLGQIWLVV